MAEKAWKEERQTMAAVKIWEIRGKLGIFTFLTACLNTLHFHFEDFQLSISFFQSLGLEMQGKYHQKGFFSYIIVLL